MSARLYCTGMVAMPAIKYGVDLYIMPLYETAFTLED